MRKAFPAIPRELDLILRGIDDEIILNSCAEPCGRLPTGKCGLLEIGPGERRHGRFRLHRIASRYSAVSLTDITKRGRQLFYQRAGREVRIERHL